ncbi:MAG: hypothetical protein M3403_04555 [Gemmatimonadota bacterium]|nr:hypothetical protein [Gemmatimonadota bacterium]
MQTVPPTPPLSAQSHPAGRPPSDAAPRLAEETHAGWQGGVISQHRAFRRARVSYDEVLVHLLLLTVISGVSFAALQRICDLWRSMFSFWQGPLNIPGEIVVTRLAAGLIDVAVPSFALAASPPSVASLWFTSVVTVVALVLTLRVPSRLIPLAYFVRAVALVQLSAVAFFAFADGTARFQLERSTAVTLHVGVFFLAITPVLCAVTYYIADVSLFKKVAFTLVTMAHLVLFIPLQHLSHSYLLYRSSLLFLPVFLVFGGVLLQVLVFVALYGWAMSWSSAPVREVGQTLASNGLAR